MIAALQLPAASGPAAMLATRGPGTAAASPKTPSPTGGGFGSFMDGCLGDDGGRGEAHQPAQRTTPGEKHPNDGSAAPTALPVAPAATVPLAHAWGLAQLESLGAPLDGAPENTAGGSQDLSGGSASPFEPEVLPQWAGTTGAMRWESALPQDESASEVDPSKGSSSTTQNQDAIPELAFGTRLFAPESVSGGPADGVARSGATAKDEPARSKNTEDLEASSGAHTELLGHGPSGGQDTAIQGSALGTSGKPDDARNTPERDASSPAISAKTASSQLAHAAGDRGDNAAGKQMDIESWNTDAPVSADRDAQPAAPRPETGVARPAEIEPPQTAAQPASRDVSLHLADGESSVDIRMAERAGEIRVTVHTPDHDLADALRADLPDLVGKLRQSGFQAEAWRPAAATQSDAGRRSGSEGAPSQEHSPGGRRDGRQPQPQRQPQKDQSQWAGEWNSSLDPAQESSI